MAEISRFFADVGGDRLTTAAQFNRIIDQLLQEQSGVIRGLGNALAVTNSGTLAVDINTGSCIKGGRIYENTASVNKPLDAVTSGSKRYDRIVVRVDETVRTMLLTVIKGVEGSNPSVPAINGTTDVLLANILIDLSSGSYVYTLTDERVYCDGLVSKAIIAKLNAGTYSEDDIADGTSYRRIQAAKADAINNESRLPTALGTADANLIGALSKIANAKLFVNAAGNGFEYAPGVKVIEATRDMTVASGTQSITGIGFKPSAIILLATIGASAKMSIGIGTALNSLQICGYSTGYYTYANGIALLRIDASNYNFANLISMDSDGFTLDWTTVGSQTGTAYMRILAFR